MFALKDFEPQQGKGVDFDPLLIINLGRGHDPEVLPEQVLWNVAPGHDPYPIVLFAINNSGAGSTLKNLPLAITHECRWVAVIVIQPNDGPGFVSRNQKLLFQVFVAVA